MISVSPSTPQKFKSLSFILSTTLLLKCQTTTPAILAISASASNLALLDARLKSTTTHVELLSWSAGRDVEVEYVHRQAECRAGIGDIDDARDVSLDGSAGKEEIDLVVRVAETAEIFDATCEPFK